MSAVIVSQFATVHPHVCGEYAVARLPRIRNDGSPPRVWGIPNAATGQSPDRFTPTCVGNTWQQVNRTDANAVHPHVCGEYLTSLSDVLRRDAVHPHVCGEYSFCCSIDILHNGSPPRVWGIRSDRSTFTSWLSVHPHVCGEYTSTPSHQPSQRFTPTCVGNTLSHLRTRHHVIRFTPTCVGNTLAIMMRLSSCGSPPRVWEYAVCLAGGGLGYGSPPRVWGILKHGVNRSFRSRSVHPHVCGEYCNWRCRFTAGLAVHPHVCGEYIADCLDVPIRARGSPPRVWGIPFPRGVGRAMRRFTPTCVGNTFLTMTI